MKRKVIEIPSVNARSFVELSNKAGLYDPMSQSIAMWYDKEILYGAETLPTNKASKILWISSFRGKADCLHSQYRHAVENQTAFMETVDVWSLYTLAAFLHENRKHSMSRFTGLVCAFGSTRVGKRTVVNHTHHVAYDMQDMETPALYVVKGVPQSIYLQWHGEYADTLNCVALQMSADLFSLEQVENWAKEAVSKKEVTV